MASKRTKCRWVVRVAGERYVSKPQKTVREAKSLARSMAAAGFRPTIRKVCVG
jgi:hypothetical protein